MELNTDFPLCILCKGNPPGDPEHIIPEFIGGKLRARILCNQCNHYLGSSLISKLPQDSSFWLAVQYLQNDIPGIYKSFDKKSQYKGISPDGSQVPIIKKDGDYLILPSKKDGVLELDNKNAISLIKKGLNRKGYDQSLIDQLVQLYKDLNEGEYLDLPNGYRFEKVPILEIKKEMPIGLIHDSFWVLLGFEFLSLFAGDAIYDSLFDHYRDFIVGNTSTAPLQIEHLQGGRKYQAIHVLILEPEGTRVKITMRIFRWITVRIWFDNIRYGGQETHYVEELIKNKCAIALSLTDVKAGTWHELR